MKFEGNVNFIRLPECQLLTSMVWENDCKTTNKLYKMRCKKCFVDNVDNIIDFAINVAFFWLTGCCIYEKPRKFGESDSESEDEAGGHDCTEHCRGHKNKDYRKLPGASADQQSSGSPESRQHGIS
jgi:hypothetical protein